MKAMFLSLICFSILIIPGYADMPAARQTATVRILSDNGGEFARYRAYPRSCMPGEYYYMEAVRGERFSIEVSNRSNRRIGVVIAVDGRNIISGNKSDLRNNERMYLIDPYTTNVFEGWRTGLERTNRFYFTGQSDSYAQKVFSDASAMGTIAVAVYREKLMNPVPITPPYREKEMKSPAGDKRSSSRGASGESSCDQAGTGFGETTYSLAREVPFEPENAMAGRIVMKYEWRSELCRKGIISCGNCEPANRLWPVSSGFAPVPGDFKE